MSSDFSGLAHLRLELAYFTGRSLLASRRAGGAGAILRFQRVRPRRSGAFQPLRHDEVTPRFLDRAITALRRWDYDIIGLDEACARAVRLATPRRFACLTFDGACKDLVTHAYPVLARHRVPFAFYVPSAFPDGLGQAWWLALEAIIAREARISLVVGRKEQHFTVFKASEKAELFTYLANWLRSLAPEELSVAIRDLCSRYSVDLAAQSRDDSLAWTDIAALAADPNVTVGSATVSYPALARLKEADVRREITMGKAVLEAALQRSVTHFAFPFGDAGSFSRVHMAIAAEAGFTSAVSTIPGVVQTEGHSPLHALPRIAWNGRSHSLRALRVLMSGAMFPAAPPMPQVRLEAD